jgi:hypothetical protein
MERADGGKLKALRAFGFRAGAFDSWTMIMKRRRAPANHFAVCIDNRGYPASLELHKIYRVLHDEEAAEDGDIRVIDESGDDYLYFADRFVEVELPQTVRRSFAHAA